MEIEMTNRDPVTGKKFKIDFIVWKLIKNLIGELKKELFKIDFIVWKFDMDFSAHVFSFNV